MNPGRGTDILALFPSFDSPVFGGVQASGRQAWRGITSETDIRTDAFYYEPGAPRLATVVQAIRRRIDADTVLVWHLGLLKLVPFIAAANRRRVLFLHGIEAWRKHDPLTSLLMRRTDLFLTNSDHTWQRFGAFHPECATAPHRTVHLGLGDSLASPAPLPAGPPAALMIGRLQKDENYKGHREMIQVWPRVVAAMPDAELWIVGGGNLRPELEQLALSRNMAGNVKFFGAVPDAQRDDLLRRCRVLALPSSGEGFGLVYLEAMRMGRPCMVSTLDAGMEVVNPPEAGLSADLADSAQTEATILRLLTAGPDWDQMAARAKARYDTHFTASQFEQRLIRTLFGK
jgi:phosphatidylinositol alpha-1,6-mannosyltransferase